jgi:hypothetical protein
MALRLQEIAQAYLAKQKCLHDCLKNKITTTLLLVLRKTIALNFLDCLTVSDRVPIKLIINQHPYKIQGCLKERLRNSLEINSNVIHRR